MVCRTFSDIPVTLNYRLYQRMGLTCSKAFCMLIFWAHQFPSHKYGKERNYQTSLKVSFMHFVIFISFVLFHLYIYLFLSHAPLFFLSFLLFAVMYVDERVREYLNWLSHKHSLLIVSSRNGILIYIWNIISKSIQKKFGNIFTIVL